MCPTGVLFLNRPGFTPTTSPTFDILFHLHIVHFYPNLDTDTGRVERGFVEVVKRDSRIL